MELSDLTPAALGRLEEKLVRDLEMVRRVKALLVEMAPGAVEPGAVPVVERAPGTQKDTETVVAETMRGLGKPFRLRELMKALPWRVDRSRLRSQVERMVKRGELRILETAPGRTGSLYACAAGAGGDGAPGAGDV